MRPAALIFNPAAGKGKKPELIAALLSGLERAGFTGRPLPTERPGDATPLARAAAREGAEAVFVLGGDGTLREAAAGVLGTGTAIGFLPGGTGNVMRHVLELPPRPLAALEALRRAAVRELDVGLCGASPFLMQASAGIDALALSRMAPTLKRLIARGAAVPAALSAWWSYGYPRIGLAADGRPLTGTFLAVCNIPFYGGRWRMQPGARPDDRRLDLVLFHGRGRAATLGLARDLALGRHLARPDVESFAAGEVELREPDGLPLQLDGDPISANLPLTIRLSPHRLPVLVPTAS